MDYCFLKKEKTQKAKFSNSLGKSLSVHQMVKSFFLKKGECGYSEGFNFQALMLNYGEKQRFSFAYCSSQSKYQDWRFGFDFYYEFEMQSFFFKKNFLMLDCLELI